MKLTSIAAAIVLTALAIGSRPARVTAAEEKVTLTGCAVKGNGDGDGFLLANSVEQTTRTTTTPTPAGSTVSSTTTTNEMKPARILYWLDDDDHEVAKLMGQLIEVTG